MPGYGVLPADEGTGLLPWGDVERRLAGSHDYWLASNRSDGRPHVMPVWGVWDGAALWFSSSNRSTKVRNVGNDPRCVVTTDDAQDPVVVEGTAEVVRDGILRREFLMRLNAKYGTDYQADLVDPDVNSTVRVTARTAFALLQSDFTGSPTRFTF